MLPRVSSAGCNDQCRRDIKQSESPTSPPAPTNMRRYHTRGWSESGRFTGRWLVFILRVSRSCQHRQWPRCELADRAHVVVCYRRWVRSSMGVKPGSSSVSRGWYPWGRLLSMPTDIRGRRDDNTDTRLVVVDMCTCITGSVVEQLVTVASGMNTLYIN